MNPAPLLGGVELGGTKCICTIGTGPGDIHMQTEVPTGARPDATLSCVETILRDGAARHGSLAALGIASFGPLDLDPASPGYGSIARTPKPGWSHTPLLTRFAHAFAVPVILDTDVNGAALAEGRWGAARSLGDFAYITVGTGVGVGFVANGCLVHGFAHPELGHLRVARRRGDAFGGTCPFHGDCVEGLASGVALAAHAGLPAERVPLEHPAFETAIDALAQLLHAVVLASAPRRIIVGGGVLHGRSELLERLRRALAQSLGGYLEPPGGLEQYVVAPALGRAVGPLGALALVAR